MSWLTGFVYPLFWLEMNCPVPKMYTKNKQEFVHQDRHNLARALVGCYQEKKHAPCLKLFYKIGKRDFVAICSAEEAVPGVE